MNNRQVDVLGVLDTLRRRALEMEREAGSEEAWTRVAQLFCELGSKFYAARSWEDASDCYDRALQAKAFFPRALRLKLELLDRQHELEQSEKLIQATERAVGDLLAYDPQCHYQKCLQLFRCGRLQEAEKELRRLVEAHRGYAGMYLLAQVLDQKGEYQEGFSWAERAGEVLLTTSSYAADSFRFHEGLQKKTRRYKTLNSSPFRNTAPGRVPHFLVGYPRSGTTLLQHMLETHPQIQTLEEQGTLDFCERFVFEPDSLISLTDTELDDAASLYWQKVETHIDGPGALILDKMPLNIVYLDAVFHLFPKSKVLMLVRDPRDVVISNLFQNFQLNRMMHAHCRLEDIVRQYQTVLDFYLQCRRWSQARLLEVKYETLIADPERVLRGVVGWLGLEWKPEILEYRSEIPRRTVRTPSYRQIARPIYQSSGGRWRNYQKQIAAFQGELQPYLQTFEYEQY